VDLAFLAMLAGGIPLVLAAWRRAPAVRRLFLVPLAAFVLAVLPVPIAVLIRGPVATINLTFTTPITDAYFVWFVALAAVSALALGRAIGASDLDGRLLRFAYLPSTVAALALLLLLASTIAWGIAAHQEFPALFDRTSLTLGYATVTSWAFDVLVMTGAALVAVLAAVRAAHTYTARLA
jgi:hypothetical protein